MIKKLAVALVLAGLAGSSSAQSLADLAKREKARRLALSGRSARVVTNADLLRVRKMPAVEIVPDVPADDYALAEDQDAGRAAGAEDPAWPEPLPGEDAGSPTITPRIGTAGPPLAAGAAETSGRSFAGQTLEAQLKAAKDLVDLLTTKMNALRQQFESQDAMVPGYVIQQQLDETNQRLVRAQAQQARIEAQIAKLGAGKKGAAR